MMQTVSEAAVQGFYYKPRVTLDNLRRHAKGMICTSACIAGIIPKYIDRGDMEGAIKWAETFRDTFDPGDFYIEIQEHGITTDNGLTDEQNAFVADVFNGMAEAESLAAYLSGLKGFEAETADLTGYVASAIFTVEASDAVKALLGDQKFAVTLKVAGVEEGMEVVAPILTAGEDGAVEYTSNAATATADGVETTVNPFGVMVVAVKNA